MLPTSAPGYRDPATTGRGSAQIGRAAADGEVSALYLFGIDPVRELPDRALWEQALHRAGLVVAHASLLTEGIREHASVVFPAESHAEKEGTVTHPDGRVQRLRAAIAHPGEVRAGWWTLSELAKRVGHDLGVTTSSMAFGQLSRAVPFYRGLTLEELGGRGVRWQERAEAEKLPRAETAPTAASTDHAALPADLDAPESGASPQRDEPTNGALRLGTYRPIWASPQVEVSPALKFAVARQQLELSPEDAQRLGIANGEEVEVRQNGTCLRGKARVRTGVQPGAVFLADGIAENSANELTGATVEVHKP